MALTQKQQVLGLLRLHARTTADWIKITSLAAEYRKVICQLRDDGYKIPATKIGKSNWKYELIEEASEVQGGG